MSIFVLLEKLVDLGRSIDYGIVEEIVYGLVVPNILEHFRLVVSLVYKREVSCEVVDDGVVEVVEVFSSLGPDLDPNSLVAEVS